MKTILVLTDSSETANHAVSYLSSIAVQLGAEKIIVYYSCYHDNPDRIMITDVLASMPSSRYESYKQSLIKLNQVKSQLETSLGSGIAIELISDERAVLQSVEDFTKNYQIDLVVLGISGNDDNGTNSVGRIPASLMKRHEFPLLIVPSLAIIAPVKTVMLACELKDIVQRLPEVPLKFVINAFDASLHIVNIDREGAIGAAAELLNEQTSLYQLLGEVEPKFYYLENEDVVAGLLEFSDQHQIDLMVAVPKQRGFLEALFHESATKKLAVNTTRPLLLLHKNN